MKLRLLVTAAALSATAYAQKPKEVVPSYTTEPVTYQAAHCPDGYQLQRWEDHDMAIDVAHQAIGVLIENPPSGYYPVPIPWPSPNPHPDKCVEIGIKIPSQSAPTYPGESLTTSSQKTYTEKLFEHSEPFGFASEGILILRREDGKSEIIPVNEKNTIQFVPDAMVTSGAGGVSLWATGSGVIIAHPIAENPATGHLYVPFTTGPE